MATVSFPRVIWMHIAHFLPALVIQDLMALNSTFFDIAMNYRYRQMSFAYLDNRMLRSLARLKDPAVAKRVRILHVYPGFVKEALDRDKLDSEGHVLRRSLRDKLADIANNLLEQKIFMKHPRIRLIRTLKRTEDVVQIMLQVLSGLPNVTDYYVTWCGLPSITATAVPFLSKVFQGSLQKLSLELSLENMRSLLTPSFKAQNLQELVLTIHSENITSVWERDEILRAYLAPAISSLRLSLKILTIQSWEPTDLSPMLYALALTRLPILEQLIIAIPVESTHLGDPEGLAQFLLAHRSSLRVLRLRATQYGGPGMTPDLVSFDQWVKNALSAVHLPKLRVLDISSNLFPTFTAIVCLQYLASTITSLSLTGSYRTYDDVEEILLALVSVSSSSGGSLGKVRNEHSVLPLARLRIGLVSLSPQLVDLISTMLLRLTCLELVVKYVLPHARDRPKDGGRQVDHFLSEMGKRMYTYWPLQHMSILADFLPIQHRHYYEESIEQAFRRSIPSLKTFA